MLTLVHWEPNTFFLKPLVALYEKAVAFEARYVDFLDPRQYVGIWSEAEVEQQHNLELEGPLLQHKGATLTESFFMCLYIEETFPGVSLLPTTARGRWEVNVWGRFAGEFLAPAVSTLGCKKYLVPALKRLGSGGFGGAVERMTVQERRNAWRKALADDYSEAELDDSRRKVGIGVNRIEEALARRSWLVGDEFSLADIDLFALTFSLPELAPELVSQEATPHLLEWQERIAGRSAVQRALGASRSGKPQHAFLPGPEHPRWG